jgi:dihydroxy-acid dehydratase
MLLGTGLQPADLDKAQVGIASMWYEGNTCNMHLDKLAARVREGVTAAGMVGMRFNTIGVSDGISMGTDGMSFSLPSRDIIADSIETVMQAQWYDGLVAIPGCDKNMPGCLIAMGRLNRPALMVYGGTIRPGHLADGTPLDIVSAFQCYGEYVAGRIDDARRGDIVRRSCPGAGQHDGHGDRGSGDGVARQCLDPGGKPRQARRVPAGGRGDSPPLGTRPQAP